MKGTPAQVTLIDAMCYEFQFEISPIDSIYSYRVIQGTRPIWPKKNGTRNSNSKEALAGIGNAAENMQLLLMY